MNSAEKASCSSRSPEAAMQRTVLKAAPQCLREAGRREACPCCRQAFLCAKRSLHFESCHIAHRARRPAGTRTSRRGATQIYQPATVRTEAE